MDSTAIEAICDLAVDAAKANRLDTHTPAFIDRDGNVESLESLGAGRSRYRGAYWTPMLSEFASYVRANKGGQGFIDTDSGLSAKVFFNLGSPDSPGHADWTATLKPAETAAYSAVLSADGSQFSQRDLANWIEDWAAFVIAYSPSGESLSLNAAVAAIRNIDIKTRAESGHSDGDFGAKRSALEEVEAKSSAGALPARLSFSVAPYLGFRRRSVDLRLSIITGEKPKLSARIIGKEVLFEDIAEEFRLLLLDSVGDSATMHIGTFSP